MLIRKAQTEDALAIAKVHVDSWRTSYPGIVSNEYLASQSYEAREKIWVGVLSSTEGQSFTFVAETRDR